MAGDLGEAPVPAGALSRPDEDHTGEGGDEDQAAVDRRRGEAVGLADGDLPGRLAGGRVEGMQHPGGVVERPHAAPADDRRAGHRAGRVPVMPSGSMSPHARSSEGDGLPTFTCQSCWPRASKA
jgi:hypothetical protein